MTLTVSVPFMAEERKSVMISARLPAVLVERVDHAVRNTDSKAVNNRSAAVCAALEGWLPAQEEKLKVLLGASLAKKAR